MNLRIVGPGPERDAYLPLFRLADDSESQILDYHQKGDLYALDDESGQPLAIVLAIEWSGDGEPGAAGPAAAAVELKAVAVASAFQGQGVGTRLLAAVLADLGARGVRRVVVGTGNSGVDLLGFYQKAGFRLWRIERDFFDAARGYPDGIVENGIPLRDMVWMDQDL